MRSPNLYAYARYATAVAVATKSDREKTAVCLEMAPLLTIVTTTTKNTADHAAIDTCHQGPAVVKRAARNAGSLATSQVKAKLINATCKANSR
jgi:hypothetical protein